MVGSQSSYLSAASTNYIAKPITQRGLHDVIAAVTGHYLRNGCFARASPRPMPPSSTKDRMAELKAFLDAGKFRR